MRVASIKYLFRKLIFRLRPPHPPMSQRILTRWVPL